MSQGVRVKSASDGRGSSACVRIIEATDMEGWEDTVLSPMSYMFRSWSRCGTVLYCLTVCSTPVGTRFQGFLAEGQVHLLVTSITRQLGSQPLRIS